MAHDATNLCGLSLRRIFGFASNQAFVFFLFYLGTTKTLGDAPSQIVRVDLLLTLAFMVVGFLALAKMTSAMRTSAFSRPLLYLYTILAAGGSLLHVVLPDGGVAMLVAEGLFVGMPLAFLLAAWGRTFGRVSTAQSVSEVFLGTFAGALVCLVFAIASPSDAVSIALRLLPLASVVNIDVPADEKHAKPISLQDEQEAVSMLSTKILAGTVLFGMAAGLSETCGAQLDGPAVPACILGFVLFAAFLIGALSLLLSDGFGRGAALNKSYRLAVFLMVVGALMALVPLLAESALTGGALVLAGYLGLEAVLVSLFLVMAKIAAIDAAHAFARGFMALFGGEVAGVVVANTIAAFMASDQAEPIIMMIAGAIALLSYVFFFTERDFDALSQIVTVSDAFEETCALMVEQYKLSKREAEILPYAVRGRTGERIAQEMFVTKSTVDTHLRRIYAKCDVHSRQELIDLFEGLR